MEPNTNTPENNVIEGVFENTTVVCPFRTKTVTTQITQTILEQTITFPECQYAHCPFYNTYAEDSSEKCLRALMMHGM